MEATIEIAMEVLIKVISRTKLKPNYSSGNP